MHSIWTHNFKGIDFHNDFQPASCPLNNTDPQMAVTIAAGEVGGSVYKVADEHGALVVGGANPVSF